MSNPVRELLPVPSNDMEQLAPVVGAVSLHGVTTQEPEVIEPMELPEDVGVADRAEHYIDGSSPEPEPKNLDEEAG